MLSRWDVLSAESEGRSTRGDAYSKRGPNTTGWLGTIHEALDSLQTAQDASKTAQEASKRIPKRAPRGKLIKSRQPFRATGGLTMSFFPLPKKPSSLRGGVLSPSPPRAVFEGVARWQGVLFRSRWLQEGLRCSKMASKMAQDSARWLKMTSIMLPRGPKRATRRLQVLWEPPQDPPKSPKSFKNLRKIKDFCILAVSLPMRFGSLKMAPRRPNKAPRGAQKAPKTAPGAPKSAPRAPQDGPNRRF